LLPFPSDDVFTLMSACIIVTVWRDFVESVHRNVDSWSTVNKTPTVTPVTSVTSPNHTIRKVLKHEYTEVTIETCKERKYFLSFNANNKLGW